MLDLRSSFLLVFIFSLGKMSFSQLNWVRVDSAFGKLPGSVKIFKTTDSLEGKPFIAFYLEADLKDKNLEFTTQSGYGKRYTPAQYYKFQRNPFLIVNGTFFSFQTNQNLNVLIRKKKIEAYNVASLKGTGRESNFYYYPTRSAIGINKKRMADVAWIFTDSANNRIYAFQDSPVVAKGRDSIPTIKHLKRYDWKKWKMVTAIGGGPVLLQNGKIHITNREEQMFINGLNDKHPRTAMGYTKNGKLIILVIQGRFPGIAEGATLDQEAQILKNLGCTEALNLDGGGSSCMLLNGKETITPSDKVQRAVPGVFLIKWKRE